MGKRPIGELSWWGIVHVACCPGGRCPVGGCPDMIWAYNVGKKLFGHLDFPFSNGSYKITIEA